MTSDSELPWAEVIGDPVDHSRSPEIHSFWLSKIGMEAEYRATRVAKGKMDAFIAKRRGDPSWRGCNITMPHKLDALLLADHQTDLAAAAKAANILVPRDGELVAANSDIGAVVRLLVPILKEEPPSGITVLGNGGAARAILVALRTLRYGAVRLQARDLTKATALAVEFGLPEAPSPFDRPIETGGLINATPLGMSGHPPFELDTSRMPDGGWIFDLVTDPSPTTLIAQAKERGMTTVDGLDMLVEQAAASFEMFFDAPAPRDADDELFARLRA